MLQGGHPDQLVSYRQLLQGAAAYARAFEQHGIQPGEVVILILQHGADLVYAFFGAVLHGAIPAIMPFLTEKLLPERYRADLAALVGITRPAAIVTYREFEPEVQAALEPGGPVRAVTPEVLGVIVSDQVGEPFEPDFAALGGMRRSPQDIVLLQHSSGTTGLQKGVALSHQAVLNQLESYSLALRLQPDDPHSSPSQFGGSEGDVIVSWLPLYHDMGLIAGFLMPILCGIPLVIMSPFEWVRAPYKLLQAVSRYKGTLAWLPNFAYNFCAQKIRQRDLAGVDLSSWRAISNCSEPMRYASHQAFLERFAPYGLRPSALATCYAMAENVFAVTQGGVDGPVTVDEIDRDGFQIERVARPPEADRPTLKMLSAGRPIRNVEIKIVADDGRTLAERQVGEVALRSDCMLNEYYHRPDATEKAFREGWYLTGDYGYMADGEVYVSGRKKDLIIVGGKNIYPQDLELLAMEVLGVHQGRVVAFGVFNEEAGTEDVVIVAEADTEDAGEREQIASSIRQVVTRGSAVALRNVYIVGPHWIAKTSSGKTARLANRDKYLAEVMD
jgi:acyl-CoA synthetase (AMP-forming)/AMP-acid ligase II